MRKVEKLGESRLLVSECPDVFGCAPGADEVFAWVIDLARPPIHPDELFRRLTAEEQVRALRYKIAKPREEFIIGRGLLRTALGKYLGIAPTAVPLSTLPSGKPFLTEGNPPLHFNVSHTDGIAVFAVSQRRVGVDVERVRTIADTEGLVKRYFSIAEGIAFRELHEQHRQAAFFRGWTTKEAVIKAAGATMGSLAEFDVELHPERPPCVHAIRNPQLAEGSWELAEWKELGDAAIAIAVEKPEDRGQSAIQTLSSDF